MVRELRGPRRLRWLSLMVVLALAALSLERGWPARFVKEDCLWSRAAEAWVDHNGNGRWDVGEPPLAGVRFGVDDLLNEYVDVGRETVSDRRGTAVLMVWLADCTRYRFEVYAKPPSGYHSVTRERVPGRGLGPFRFGFTPTTLAVPATD